MKLGLMVGYWMFGPMNPVPLAQEAERLGFDKVFTAEAYGSDCFSPLCWIGAHTERIKLGTGIMQIAARTPACAAMTAMTIDHLSQGRLILGIGVSGPQVVEGWYGQPFPKPLARTREYINLFRQIWERKGPVEFQGEHYQLPLQGGARMGKPLKLINKPYSERLPIYLAAEGPKNIAMATELCEGWLPLYYSPFRPEIYGDSIASRPAGFEICPPVTVSVGADWREALTPVKYMLAFYIGGMGHKKQNFHANLVARFGYGDAVEKIQEAFWAGRRDEAASYVPDEFADEISLCGPIERIRERLEVWKQSAVTTLLAATNDVNAMRALAEAAL